MLFGPRSSLLGSHSSANARQLAADNEECHGNQWGNNSLLQEYNEMKLAQTVKQTIYGHLLFVVVAVSLN